MNQTVKKKKNSTIWSLVKKSISMNWHASLNECTVKWSRYFIFALTTINVELNNYQKQKTSSRLRSFFTRDRLNWCDFNSWFQQRLIKCCKVWWNKLIWWFVVREFIWLSINSFFNVLNEDWWNVHSMILSKKIHLTIINALFMRLLNEWKLIKCSSNDSL